jgi:hypothetical protein
VCRVMVCVSEKWAAKVEDLRKLAKTETAMVRWMCGVTLKDRKSHQELLRRLGVEHMKCGRLLWFCHFERMPREDWVKIWRFRCAN